MKFQNKASLEFFILFHTWKNNYNTDLLKYNQLLFLFCFLFTRNEYLGKVRKSRKCVKCSHTYTHTQRSDGVVFLWNFSAFLFRSDWLKSFLDVHAILVVLRLPPIALRGDTPLVKQTTQASYAVVPLRKINVLFTLGDRCIPCSTTHITCAASQRNLHVAIQQYTVKNYQ